MEHNNNKKNNNNTVTINFTTKRNGKQFSWPLPLRSNGSLFYSLIP